MEDRIGWIGLGAMGGPMAANIAKAGFNITVCDIDPEAIAKLEKWGVAQAPSARAIASVCDVVFVCLPNPDVSTSVAEEVFAASSRPKVYVELSTLDLSLINDIAAKAKLAGVEFLDAPVSGSVQARNEGTLSVMVGGSEISFRRIRPILELLGKSIFLLGPVGSGSIAKICNNLIAHASLVAVIEGLLLGERCGLDVATLSQVIMTASGAQPAVPLVAEEYRNRCYRKLGTSRAALRLVAKDLKLAVDLAENVGLKTPGAKAAASVWRDAELAGFGDQDFLVLLDYISRQQLE